ncbi:MAG TPA: aminoglycoside phosphotransferase family protein [Gemmataceae bacterium]|nr:aminoglycoside phosphotransferase family protein [Gemmataceae bacterium]
MLELTAANAADYVRRKGWIRPGPVEVEPLGGGVSNAILRVRTPERVFVLKQSRPQLRTRDAWFSDLDRVFREQEVMHVLHPLLPPLTVPEILHSDRNDYVFAMSSAADGARSWKESLLAGAIDMAIGERAGAVLGRMHDATARNPSLIESFHNRTVFVQLRVDPFYRRIQERRPEVAAAVAPLVDGLMASREALCHGDYSPKNILTHEHGFTLVDYETAHQGDPAMDLGFFLSHLLLKAARRPAERRRFFELTRMFWRGYGSLATFIPQAQMERRAVGHCGLCLLARIDGTSPVDYLAAEDQREAVRRLGRALLLEQPTAWEDVLAQADAEIAA